MPRFLRRYIPALLVLATGLTITAMLCHNEQAIVQTELQRHLLARLHETSNLISQSLKAHETMLRGVQGLFAGSDVVEPQEFRDFIVAMGLGNQLTGLRCIGYCQLNQGKAILGQIEPDIGANHRQIGFDLRSVPSLAATMDRARDSGQPVISGKLGLPSLQGTQEQAGFAFFFPLFHKGIPHDSLSARQAGLWGWVYAPFIIKELLDSLSIRNLPDIRFQIFDGPEMTPENQLYDSADPASIAAPSAFSGNAFLEYGGHGWAVWAGTTPEFEKRYGKDMSGLIAGGGSALSLLVAALAWLLESSRVRALALADSMTQELREAKEHFEQIFNTNPDATILTRLSDDRIINVNESFTALTGYSAGEVIGKPIQAISFWADLHDRKDLIAQLHATGYCQNHEAQLRRKDGSTISGMISARISTIQGIPHLLSVTRDISEWKANEVIIHHMAHYDALTDLPNRALFTDRLLQSLAQAKRDKTRLAVIFIDLDRFKRVNDQYGHQTGDLFLKEVARRILTCLRESDTVGRIGGDEFVVRLAPAAGFA